RAALGTGRALGGRLRVGRLYRKYSRLPRGCRPAARGRHGVGARKGRARARATVWGRARVGAGLGGACFQHASGLTVAHLRTTIGVAGAYHTVFVAYGVLALVGLTIVLFSMGPLPRD